MKHKSEKIKKPNVVLFYCVCFLLKFYYKLKFGLTIDKSLLKGINPPFLLVASHSCWLDHMITSIGMFPLRMNYVAAYNFFRDRLLKYVFNFMGVISKYQFTNDLTAVKKMKKVTDRGGIVAIFPNGCLSMEGRPGGFAVFGIAKLIKFLNVPVVALKTDGGYLTRPRWTKQVRYGRIEVKVSPILDLQEVKSLSEADIYNKVTGAIDFDDYKWQRERMIQFKGRRMAEGVEFVLFKCPKCQEEFTLRSEGNRFFCTTCGNAVILNQYSFFEPENKDVVYFEGIDQWYDFQKDCVNREIADSAFELTAQTELRCAEQGKFGYQHLGFGTVSLTREELLYYGNVANERKQLAFPMKSIPMVPYSAGEYIEIARGSEISRFVFDDPRQQIKWVMAIRLIRDKYYEGLKDDE